MIVNETQWHRALPEECTLSNEVHVWRVFLDLDTLQTESLLGTLSADEVKRAGRFRFERDQKRFITARGMLRQILGCYLGTSPHKLRFEYTPLGKPMLAANSGSDTLCFNMSHADAFAVYAITRDRSIGIDIERKSDDIAIKQIVQRFFSQGEISSLERIHENMRNEVFFQYWTRKEAFLKATGDGMSFPMEQFDVSLINGRGWLPVTLMGDKRGSGRWYVQDLFPGHGYAAAIAVEGGQLNLSWWHYSA